MTERILVVDDTPGNVALLAETLEPHGYEILVASRGEVALKIVQRTLPDLILLDIVMPGRDGFEICRELKSMERTREAPVLFITGRNETEAVTKGFDAGAVDYILKPFRAEEVVSRVKTHLRIAALTRELREKNRELEEEITRRRSAEEERQFAVERLSTFSSREADRWGVAGLIGTSGTIQNILKDVQKLHQFSNTNVLITGESGTGKELIARAIHFGSSRADSPFIPVNCVAVPDELAESMLFGHLKGSFTGATADRKGYFELADGGTLFLDEIGDMPAGLQGKLLRVLEDGCVTPVGGTKPKRVDVRVLAATNADLQRAMDTGSFRRDLYYRLARYTVHTPPLHERREDIPLLAKHFLRVFAEDMGMKPPQFTNEAIAVLVNYPFPGNVRELKNIIERGLIESGGMAIRPEHFHLPERPAVTESARETLAAKGQLNETASGETDELPLNLEQAEDILIQKALARTGGNIAEAARLLGVHRTRIYRKING